MKFSSFPILCTAHSGLASILQPRVCGNNCARGVTGNANGPAFTSKAKADCCSFQLATVTRVTTTVMTTSTLPIIATATVYTTVTTYSLIGSAAKRSAAAEPILQVAHLENRNPEPTPITLKERQVTVVPSSTPTYASACSGAVCYSSACSCYGITATTTTAPTPIYTSTITISTVASTITTTLTVAVPSGVCDPAQNYGAIYQQGTRDSSMSLVMYYSSSTPNRCARSFTEEQNSSEYLFNPANGACCLCNVQTGNGQSTATCPSGSDHMELPLAQGGYSGILVGVGPCGTNN